MLRRFLASITCFLLLAHEVVRGDSGGPVLILSDQPVPSVKQDKGAVDLQALIKSTISRDGVKVVFIGPESTPEQFTSTYLSETSNLSAPFKADFKSSTNRLTPEHAEALADSVIFSPPAPNTIDSTKLTIVNIAEGSDPVKIINEYIDALHGRQYQLIISGPLINSDVQKQETDEDSSRRRLQEVKSENSEIQLERYELPGIFVMIAIVILLFIGFSCLADVNCPVSYEEKTLVLNKEF